MKAGLFASSLEQDLVGGQNIWETFCLKLPESFEKGGSSSQGTSVWLRFFPEFDSVKTGDTRYLNYFVKCFFLLMLLVGLANNYNCNLWMTGVSLIISDDFYFLRIFFAISMVLHQ